MSKRKKTAPAPAAPLGGPTAPAVAEAPPVAVPAQQEGHPAPLLVENQYGIMMQPGIYNCSHDGLPSRLMLAFNADEAWNAYLEWAGITRTPHAPSVGYYGLASVDDVTEEPEP